MSVDISWESLTGGSDGQTLAETIREFIHERFQQIPLPKLIRSVKVRSFDFGTIAPDIVLKDICDPLPDFYETEDERGDEPDVNHAENVESSQLSHTAHSSARHVRSKDDPRRLSELEILDRTANHSLARGAILGNSSHLNYFQLPGFSGTTTPLAAVAGAHFQSGPQTPQSVHHQSTSFGSVSPPSTTSPPSRPISRDRSYFGSQRASVNLDGPGEQTPPTNQAEIERNPEDTQIVFHVTYSGDVKLSMTAEVFLDFPMPSFVGIPLKLNITGVTFNGVGILAYIKNRAHLSFLSPEDAEALVGSEDAHMSLDGAGTSAQPSRVGGLLEEIKIESEMGETGEGKQVLKNVGKIEKFILEQVQRIFEEEFVYPSFWTFLV